MRQIILDMMRCSNTREIPPSLATLSKEIGERDLYSLCARLLKWCRSPCIPEKLDATKAFPRIVRDAISRTPELAQIFLVDKHGMLDYSRRVSREERFEIAKYVTAHHDERFGHSVYIPPNWKPPATQDDRQ